MSEADWAATELPTMWISAQAADTQMAWDQVAAWVRTQELLLHHELRLRALRNELTALWPPSRSSAANAFIQYMDGLLVALENARASAGRNREGLKLLLESLGAAKKDMADLKAKWDKNEREDASRAQNLVNMSPHSAGQNWKQDLNSMAKARMVQNDREVLEASARLTNLPPAHGAPYGDTPRPFGAASDARNGTTPGAAQPSSTAVPTVTPVSQVDAAASLAGVW